MRSCVLSFLFYVYTNHARFICTGAADLKDGHRKFCLRVIFQGHTTVPSAALPDLPRTLILDADDSYTRNILDLILHVYPSGSAQRNQLDSRVLLLRANKFDWATLSTQIIPHFAAIILGPGPGRPAAARPDSNREHPASIFTRIFSPNTLPSLCGHHIPTFGLCLGHQALGFAYGAAVQPAPQVLHGQICSLELELDHHGQGKGVLNLLDQGTPVVRYNSLTVDPESISPDIHITAWAQDGPSRTVMGLSHNTLPFHSVQFHPESVCSTNGTQILRSFFEIVVNSSYVNSDSGLGRLAAYSPLPDHILQHSDLTIRPNPVPHPSADFAGSHNPFQLRTLVVKNSHLTPENVFQGTLSGISQLGHVWLDSADSLTSNQQRYSHMGSVDLLLSYFASRKSLSIKTTSSEESCDRDLGGTTIWAWLREVQDILQASTEILPISKPAWNTSECNVDSTTPVRDQRRAPVGFMGYLNYELLSESLGSYALPCRSTSTIPDAELGFCNTALTYEHSTSSWYASALVLVNPQRSQNLRERFDCLVGLSEIEYQDWTRRVEEILKAPPTCQSNTVDQNVQINLTPEPPMPNRYLEPIISEADYLLAISKAQAQITAGESYELCLTIQFRGTMSCPKNHLERYLGLRKANPAPYGAYIHFAPYDTHILSSSPERFMSIDCDSRVEMKPIKGTARRNLTDPTIDSQLGERLQNDPKERAENLMITDLIRHDLHGFCEPGSVKVTKLFGLETVATVHSLVSTVVGLMRPDLNAVDALCSAFPPGSMTGAPKISSVEILDTLEKQQPRGTYSGILGLIAVDGRCDMSVVIRTAIIRGSTISVGGGGAITSLSKKEDEWKEVKLKIEAVQRNLNLS